MANNSGKRAEEYRFMKRGKWDTDMRVKPDYHFADLVPQANLLGDLVPHAGGQFAKAFNSLCKRINKWRGDTSKDYPNKGIGEAARRLARMTAK